MSLPSGLVKEKIFTRPFFRQMELSGFRKDFISAGVFSFFLLR